MGARDYYRILQVSRHAEPEVIEKAYKALCMKYHPDRMSPEKRAEANRRMQAINEAYAVLGSARKRNAYDSSLPIGDGGSDSGWERFLEDGLIGLFQDWARRRS